MQQRSINQQEHKLLREEKVYSTGECLGDRVGAQFDVTSESEANILSSSGPK